MGNRYFLANLDSEPAELSGPEAHHLRSVMRGKVGDRIRLFDGDGRERIARIESIGKTWVRLELEQWAETAAPPRVDLTIACALPKGDRLRWLVEKLTELDVSTLVPLASEHAGEKSRRASLDRLQRWSREACKQCERNTLLQIEPVTGVDKILESLRDGTRLIAHQGGVPIGRIAECSEKQIIAAVGPEGGWSPREVLQAKEQGWTEVSLGARILRCETAAVVCAAVLAAAW